MNRHLCLGLVAVLFCSACSTKATDEWCARAKRHSIQLSVAAFQKSCPAASDAAAASFRELSELSIGALASECPSRGKYDPAIADCFFAATTEKDAKICAQRGKTGDYAAAFAVGLDVEETYKAPGACPIAK